MINHDTYKAKQLGILRTFGAKHNTASMMGDIDAKTDALRESAQALDELFLEVVGEDESIESSPWSDNKRILKTWKDEYAHIRNQLRASIRAIIGGKNA